MFRRVCLSSWFFSMVVKDDCSCFANRAETWRFLKKDMKNYVSSSHLAILMAAMLICLSFWSSSNFRRVLLHLFILSVSCSHFSALSLSSLSVVVYVFLKLLMNYSSVLSSIIILWLAPMSQLTYKLINQVIDDLPLDLVDARRVVRVVRKDAIDCKRKGVLARIAHGWDQAVTAARMAYGDSVLQDHLNRIMKLRHFCSSLLSWGPTRSYGRFRKSLRSHRDTGIVVGWFLELISEFVFHYGCRCFWSYWWI